MRSALLAACALVVAAPAWAQDAANATAEAKRLLTDLAAETIIHRCEGLWPEYLAFTKDGSGTLHVELLPVFEEVSRIGNRTIARYKGALYVISDTEVVEMGEGEAKVYPCEDAGMDLFLLLTKLIENAG